MNDLEIIYNIQELYEHKVVLFGAGDIGKRIQNQLLLAGIKVISFVDNDPLKWGDSIQDVPVISLQEAVKLYAEEPIIAVIAVRLELVEGIWRIIDRYGLNTCKVCTAWGISTALMHNSHCDFMQEKAKTIFATRWKMVYSHGRTRYMNSYRGERNELTKMILESENLIGLYTMPKVGSISVRDALREAGYDPFHHHDFRDDAGKAMMDAMKQKGVTIISLVRDPLARLVSEYFFHIGFFDYLDGLRNVEAGENVYRALKERMKRFHLQYDFSNWFEKELQAVTGIDVLEYPFDKERGYMCVEKEGIRLMIMTLEKMSTLENELAEFVGTDTVEIGKRNASDNFETKYAYKEFVQNVSFNEEELSEFYDNKYVKHFYSAEQIEIFKNKWRK